MLIPVNFLPYYIIPKKFAYFHGREYTVHKCCVYAMLYINVRSLGCRMNFQTSASNWATSEFVAIRLKAIGLNKNTKRYNGTIDSTAGDPITPTNSIPDK